MARTPTHEAEFKNFASSLFLRRSRWSRCFTDTDIATLLGRQLHLTGALFASNTHDVPTIR
jgi:hypothetical protein